MPTATVGPEPPKSGTPTAKSPGPSSPASRRPISSSISDGGSFAPGEVLADRYRIIALLGRGGMGEVYRADDLKLGQPVALKFLPPAMAQDESFIERFRAEVRNARQVSHPNVCRVYDLGEIEGRPFLSMEYVDGEDLASLLKRIGRLPSTKAIELARQICAGLAAAHAKGLIHRDLKPANVMIDGQGRARVTDFGLAVRPDEAGAEGRIIGTPAYMSPEQLAGHPATIKSDLYALGLVLYEMSTGKRAFEATTIPEWRRKHEEEEPTAPSSYATDVDPATERIILRCLEKDPKLRPASALQVAAGLPGGDPLAAALAAGETPSPELVAAAGETEGLKPGLAVGLLGFVILAIAAAILLVSRGQIFSFVPLGEPAEVLASRARSLITQLGYTTPPVDSAYDYSLDQDYMRYIRDHDKSPDRWERLRSGNPSAIEFWYRQSPRYLEATNFIQSLATGVVSQDDPPRDISGMTYVVLDPSGRLEHFEAVPPQLEPVRSETAKGSEPKGGAPDDVAAGQADWAELFKAAGLDLGKFKPATPEWTPPVWSDTRAAWTGTAPGLPGVPLRVEAAAFRGKPVYFQLIWPWTSAARMQTQPGGANQTVQEIFLVLFLVLMVGAVLLARRNLRLGRGDRRGAFRLALFVLAALLLAWVLTAHHVPTSHESALFVMGASFSLFFAAQAWLFYIALEPYVRRRWPNSMISWSRMVTGQLRDPLVGRDVLIGVALGLGVTIWAALDQFAEGWFGKLPPRPEAAHLSSLLGVRFATGQLFGLLPQGLASALAAFLLFFLLRLLFRRDSIAMVAFVLIFVAIQALPSNYPLVDGVFYVVAYAVVILILKRFGLVPLTVFFFTNTALGDLPLTTHLSAWYAQSTYVALAFILALAIYGFRVSLAGRPIFSGAALDE